MSIEVGTKTQGKVTGITSFGAFVELTDGKTGLVHISEVANEYVKDINDFLKIGDIVEVKVLSIQGEKTQLSIKKAKETPKPEASTYTKKPAKQGKFANHNSNNRFQKKESFEDKLKDFLKTSEENLSSLKRNSDRKSGGRGGRRG